MGKRSITFIVLLIATLLILCGCRAKKNDPSVTELDLGNQELDQGNYEEAVSHYTKALEEDDSLAVAYNNRALAFIRLDRLDEAESDLQAALALEEASEYYSNYSQIDLKKEDYQQAVDHLTKAIELDSRIPDNYSNRAMAYQKLGKDDQAISDYTQAIALGQKDNVLYNNRGIAYMNTGEYDKAAADFTTALKGDHADKNTILANRAEAYLRAEDYQNAVADYEALVEAGVDPNGNRKVIGRIYLQMENYTEAARVLALIDKEERDEETILLLADSYFRKEDYPSALGYYTELVDLRQDAKSYGLRAECYLRLYDTEAALEDLNKAIKLDPEYGWAYYTRGSIYLDQGEYEKAEEDFSKAGDLAFEPEGSEP